MSAAPASWDWVGVRVCAVCKWAGPRKLREVNWCGTHLRWCCRVCWHNGKC